MTDERCDDCDSGLCPDGTCPCRDFDEDFMPLDAYDNETNNMLALWRKYE